MKHVIKLTALSNKFIRDKNGKLAVWQTPNLPIVLWFVCMLIARFVPDTSLKNGFELLSAALLLTWAYLEITEGSSYFRRVLGGVVMTWVVFGQFDS